MSTEDLGEALNEKKLAETATSPINLILGMTVKYGLPSLVCVLLFYVIWAKDNQIFNLTEKVTTALIENNHTIGELSNKLSDLADAIKDLK